MEILLSVSYTLLFCFIISRWSFFDVAGIDRRYFMGILLLKIMSGVALWAIYTFYYTQRLDADIYKYFDDSAIMFGALAKNPTYFLHMLTGIGGDPELLKKYYYEMNSWYNFDLLFNDNRTMIRLNTLFRFCSLGFYNVHSVFMAFISLVGLTALFKFFVRIVPHRKSEMFLYVFLLPSVMFWGSGVLKDSLLFTVLGLLLLSMGQLYEKVRARDLIIFLLALGMFLFVKTYVLMIILPGLAAWWWINQTGYRNASLKFIGVYLMAAVVVFNLHHFIKHYDLAYLIYIKQQNFIHLAHATDAGSLLNVTPLEPTVFSLIANAPLAILHTLTRPYLFESMSPLYLMAGFENLVILLLCGYYIWCGKLKMQLQNQRMLLLFALALVLILFALIGLVTPVIGAMVRYKAVGLPFLMAIFVLLSDETKVKTKIKYLGKAFSIFDRNQTDIAHEK